jgi:hypothetical protein
MPHDLLPWDNVYDHFRRWKRDGTLEKIHDALRAEVRIKDGREPTPSAVIIDSQSVETTEKGGHQLRRVHEANVADSVGARPTFSKLGRDEYPRLERSGLANCFPAPNHLSPGLDLSLVLRQLTSGPAAGGCTS